MTGSSLSHYRIGGRLGAGGMGEVYRATDENLSREVAIKVLPPEVAEDGERLARFRREALLLASLNHPNVAHVYGFESAAGPAGSSAHFLVMELIEGEDLGARLKRGKVPVEEALQIAEQVAEALEEAHERGIVHRDLKPANVKVTPEGRVKVLDFGLAKAYAGDSATGSSPDLSQSPTLAHTGTQAGIILGTAAYMSPEQARGKPVDKRADIWAFGVLLYELLTGRPLFEGETVSDVLAGVLKTDIDLGGLPEATPPPVRQLLQRCLERQPRSRLRDIGEARLALEDALKERAGERPTASLGASAGPLPWRRAAPLAVLALAVGTTAGWLLHPGATTGPPVGSRWALALPDGFSFSTGDTPQVALSPDGRLQLAVVVGPNGVGQLLLRRSDEFEPRLVEGTEGAGSPFFSPDGAWMGFFRDQALLKMPTGGGPPIRLAKVGTGDRGATWSSDGYIYFVPDYSAPIVRVSASGGDVQEVTHLDPARSERTHRWPEALPGGEAVLFTCDTLASTEYYDDARIEAVRPATGERRVLVEGASQARYAPGGHLVFARGGSLFAVEFDPRTLEVRGNPRPVVQGVATNVGSGAVQFAIAQSGAAVWAPGGLAALYRIVWVDRSGVESPVDVPPGPYQELALSPDGRRLALVGGQGGISDLWVADLQRGALTRLTSGEFVRNPIWTPDGTRVVFTVISQGAGEDRGRIDWRPADGSQAAETLVKVGPAYSPSAITPDGRTLLYDRGATGASGDIFALPLDGERRARSLTSGPFLKYSGVLSPDGRWLAYVSNESGQPSVYVRPFPRGEGRWPISIPQGDEPVWGPSGRELFYRSNSVLYRVAIDTAHGFTAGRPQAFLDRVASGSQVHSYGFSPDGSRIVTERTAEGSGAQRVLYLDLGFAGRLGRPGPGS